jgi:hypothetical protein
MSDHFAYSKSETHTSSVQVWRLLQASKKLKNVLHVTFLHAQSSVFNCYRKHLLIVSNIDSYPALECELDRIAN